MAMPHLPATKLKEDLWAAKSDRANSRSLNTHRHTQKKKATVNKILRQLLGIRKVKASLQARCYNSIR